MTIQKTLDENIVTIFNNGLKVGEIATTEKGFEALSISGVKAVFNSFNAAKKLFEEVCKPTVIKRNNQLNLF